MWRTDRDHSDLPRTDVTAASATLGGAAAARPASQRFAALVPRHTAAMMRVAAALVGLADAEDAAQEALVRAWRAWGTLRDEASVRAWLLRITVNVCRGWQRGSQGQQTRLARAVPDDEQDCAGLESLATPQDEPGTSDHAGALDLRQAVRSLPPHYRVVVVLRYYGGLQANEIADILSVPPVTIRTRQHRALLLLRQRLEAEGADTVAGDADVER